MTLRCKVLKNGEGKGSGLACAGLRLADHICPLKHDRDDGGLNGCRLGIAKLGNRLHEFLAQVQGSKIGCHLFLLIVAECFDDSFYFLLANQSSSSQRGPPNKKARSNVHRAVSRVLKTIPKLNYSGISITWFL